MKLKRILMLCVAVCATGCFAFDAARDLGAIAARFRPDQGLSKVAKNLLSPGLHDGDIKEFFNSEDGARFIIKYPAFIAALRTHLGPRFYNEFKGDNAYHTQRLKRPITGFDLRAWKILAGESDSGARPIALQQEPEETEETSPPASPVYEKTDEDKDKNEVIKFLHNIYKGEPQGDISSIILKEPVFLSSKDLVVEGEHLLKNSDVLRFLLLQEGRVVHYRKLLTPEGKAYYTRMVLLHADNLEKQPFRSFVLSDALRNLIEGGALTSDDPALVKLFEFLEKDTDSVRWLVGFLNHFQGDSGVPQKESENISVITQALHDYSVNFTTRHSGDFPVYSNFFSEVQSLIPRGDQGGTKFNLKAFQYSDESDKFITDRVALMDKMKADVAERSKLQGGQADSDSDQSSWFTPSRQKMAWGIGAGVGLTAVLAQILHAVKDKDELVATYIKRKLGYKNLRKLSRTEEARARRRVVGLLFSFLVTGVAGYKYLRHS